MSKSKFYDSINETINFYNDFLKVEFPEFYNYMDFFGLLSLTYLKAGNQYFSDLEIDDIPYENKKNFKHCNVIFTLKEVSKFLGNIDQDYKNLFWELYDNGVINFMSIRNHLMLFSDKKEICINLKNNINDSLTLVHEFFHYMNVNNESIEYSINKQLTEFISIFFELYYCDNSPYHDDYLDIYRFRAFRSYVASNHTAFIFYILNFYNKEGDFDEYSRMKFEQLHDVHFIDDEHYSEFINGIMETFCHDGMISILRRLKYSFGFSLYCYIKKYFNIDDIFIEKMKLLNTKITATDINLSDALKIIDIDINDDNFFNKVYESLLDEFELIKSLTQKKKLIK